MAVQYATFVDQQFYANLVNRVAGDAVPRDLVDRGLLQQRKTLQTSELIKGRKLTLSATLVSSILALVEFAC